jgi:hypothetical protein
MPTPGSDARVFSKVDGYTPHESEELKAAVIVATRLQDTVVSEVGPPVRTSKMPRSFPSGPL